MDPFPLGGLLYVGAALAVLPATIRRPPTAAATASLLLNLELVATVLLAAAVFHEHIGSRVAAGTALVVAGGAVLGVVVVARAAPRCPPRHRRVRAPGDRQRARHPHVPDLHHRHGHA